MLEFGPGEIGLELDPPQEEEEMRPLLTSPTPLNVSKDGRLYTGKKRGRAPEEGLKVGWDLS